jgi:hypothetical protein
MDKTCFIVYFVPVRGKYFKTQNHFPLPFHNLLEEVYTTKSHFFCAASLMVAYIFCNVFSLLSQTGAIWAKPTLKYFLGYI